MLPEVDVLYEFGSYRLDASKRLLTRDGKHLAVAPKTFDLLLLFIRSQGRVLTKTELMSSLWPDTFVEEANLSFQISTLRKAVGNEGLHWIETVPKHGYRFSAAVLEVFPGQLVSREEVRQARSSNGHDESSIAVAVPEAVPARSSGLRSILWPLIATVSTLVSIFLGVSHWRQPAPSKQLFRFLVSPSDKLFFRDDVPPAISPEGERITFVGVEPDGRRRLWVRALDSPVVEPLPGTEFVDSVFWSPDGHFVGFFANGKLKAIDVRGGSPQTITNIPGGIGAGSWGRDGVILFQTNAHLQLYRVQAGGGEPKPATTLNSARKEVAHYAPHFLPDGQHFLYFVQSERPENTGIYLGSLDSQDSKYLLNSNTNAAYAQSADGTGYLLFTSGTTLMGQVFDPRTQRLARDPFPIAKQVLVTLATGLHRAAFSASENGVLAYRTGIDAGSTELVWFDRHGRRLDRVGEPGEYTNPALSPDEKNLLVSRMDPQSANRDLVLFDLTRGISSQFTFDPADESNAVWSPDGRKVAFSAVRNGFFAMYQKGAASTLKPELLMESGENNFVHSWSPDGNRILFRTVSGYWTLSLDSNPRTKKLLRAGRIEMSANAELSPDGRWVAYQLDESSRSEVYVIGLTTPGNEWHVSTAGGIEPRWRRDGKELYYIAANTLMAVPVKTSSGNFEAGVPQPLFGVQVDSLARRSRYQVAANGSKFLVAALNSSSPITVVVNWAAGTKP